MHSHLTSLPTPDKLRERLETAWEMAWRDLAAERIDAEHRWSGRLSTSALSTATAVSALVSASNARDIEQRQQESVKGAIAGGCDWLARHQNTDGGFGDTDRSHSNIATTLLVLAAWQLADYTGKNGARDEAWQYVKSNGSWDGLKRRYGKDKTFVVPILSNCALAGLVPWEQVPALPFEAAWLPQRWYRMAKMPVVSYAIPALVAIGQLRFHVAPPGNPLLRSLRKRAQQPTLRVLRNMQPESGGYLEAVPLTSFVLMSLAAAGNGKLMVAQECIRFLIESRLDDGSWPIDTNLATWVTSLTACSLARRSGNLHMGSALESPNEQSLITPQTVRWLLRCQHVRRHPFTGADPGGWGWTNLSGAVPDADDTPAALLALSKTDLAAPGFARLEDEVLVAVGRGLRWLLDLQNNDGGWPTFCRGWGQLPFDRSGTDLTAHAIRAFAAWASKIERVRAIYRATPTQREIARAVRRGFYFLEKSQLPDGSWLPLWFGNQDREQEDNPVYGTGKALLAFASSPRSRSPAAQAAIAYLRSNQNTDGGWGGGISTTYSRAADADGGVDREQLATGEIRSTIEETAVALEGLILCAGHPTGDATIMRGLDWLAAMILQGELSHSWPIGFYFAKLWYYERLYPTIFSLGALGAAIRSWDETQRQSLG